MSLSLGESRGSRAVFCREACVDGPAAVREPPAQLRDPHTDAGGHALGLLCLSTAKYLSWAPKSLPVGLQKQGLKAEG